MAPTSVIPFQHFLSPTSPVVQSPGGHASIASGSPQISNAAALFSAPLFDDRFSHTRHHHSTSFIGHHHNHHNHNHHHHSDHHTPTSPSTPRDSYNDNSTRLNHAHAPPTTTNGYNSHTSSSNHNSGSGGGGHRWDPSPSALDDVSRGAPGSGGGSSSSSSSGPGHGFTLPPIVPIGTTTPRTSLTAGPTWDSTSAQYAAAQWGAYTGSSSGTSLRLIYYFLFCFAERKKEPLNRVLLTETLLVLCHHYYVPRVGLSHHIASPSSRHFASPATTTAHRHPLPVLLF